MLHRHESKANLKKSKIHVRKAFRERNQKFRREKEGPVRGRERVPAAVKKPSKSERSGRGRHLVFSRGGTYGGGNGARKGKTFPWIQMRERPSVRIQLRLIKTVRQGSEKKLREKWEGKQLKLR